MPDTALELPSDGNETLPDSPKSAWGSVSRNPQRIHLLLGLKAEGKSQKDIAQILGISPAEVSRTIADYTPTLELARKRLDSAQLEAVDSLVRAMPAAEKKGLAGPQTAILEAGGLLKANEKGQGVTVIIGGVSDADIQINVNTFAVDSTPQQTIEAQVLRPTDTK